MTSAFAIALIVIITTYIVVVAVTAFAGLLMMVDGSTYGPDDEDYVRGKILLKNALLPFRAMKKVIEYNLRPYKEED